jgi:hypothetical protein
MLILDVRVPANRNQAAIATLYADKQVLKTGHAAASVARELAAQKGNPSCDMMRQWGNPAFGSYRLLGSANVPECCRGEYGLVLLAFEPQSGVALDAESFGRLGLAVYAGAAGSDRRPRRTQGGLRISEEFMKLIRLRMATEAEIRVSLSPLVPPIILAILASLADSMPVVDRRTSLHRIASRRSHLAGRSDAPCRQPQARHTASRMCRYLAG